MGVNAQAVGAAVKTGCVLIVNLAALGGVALDPELVTFVACGAVAVGSVAFGCWNNMNFTQAAQLGQEVVDAVKSGRNVTVMVSDSDEGAGGE